jgi:hypothetical protein
MYICMYICTYICRYVRMYVCTYVRMYVCTYVRMYVCTYVRMYVCTYVRMYVCTYCTNEICKKWRFIYWCVCARLEYFLKYFFTESDRNSANEGRTRAVMKIMAENGASFVKSHTTFYSAICIPTWQMDNCTYPCRSETHYFAIICNCQLFIVIAYSCRYFVLFRQTRAYVNKLNKEVSWQQASSKRAFQKGLYKTGLVATVYLYLHLVCNSGLVTSHKSHFRNSIKTRANLTNFSHMWFFTLNVYVLFRINYKK